MLKLPPIPILPTIQEAFQAGQNCGQRRATTRNTNFRYFATPELRDAWERGLKSATAPKKETVTR